MQHALHQLTQTVLVQSMKVIVTPIVAINVPLRAKTKQAFDEVSSVLHIVSSQQEVVHTEIRALSQEMEQMRKDYIGEMESTIQVKATLQRSLSASSSLEMRIGQAEAQQEHAHSVVKVTMETSERAIAQATQLKAEQERTSQ